MERSHNMTCLEAQSKIIAYIDHNLEKDEKTDFLRHIKNCEDCKDELNIYYTMIEGMRQLDGNLPLSKDFTAELNNRIERELKQNKKKQEFLRSSICIVIIGVLGFGIFGYINFLNILHNDEQKKLKEAQGEYYFSQTFDDILFNSHKDDNTLNINVTQEEEESFYEKVRKYKMLQ